MRELQRAFIYTSTLSKQAIEGHVSTAFIAYSVSEGARLTKDMYALEHLGGEFIIASFDEYIQLVNLQVIYTER